MAGADAVLDRSLYARLELQNRCNDGPRRCQLYHRSFLLVELSCSHSGHCCRWMGSYYAQKVHNSKYYLVLEFVHISKV